MRTDALIEMLAAGPVAVGRHTVERRLAGAAALGLAVSATAMLAFLGLRPDLAAAAALPMFWLKLAVPILLAAAFAIASARLASPGGVPAWGWLAAAALLLALWAMAFAEVARVPPDQRAAMIEGASAWPCVASIGLLSVPPMVSLFIAIRGLAPTRATRAGLAAGALAGSLAAAVYALHCNETALPFLAVWYVLGIGLAAALGAAAGTRLLRWE